MKKSTSKKLSKLYLKYELTMDDKVLDRIIYLENKIDSKKFKKSIIKAMVD